MKKKLLQTTKYKPPTSHAMSVVEVLLALALFSLVVMAITGALIYGRESAQTSGMRARAVFLAEEGLEATRNIRDNAFANLTDGNHGVAKTTQWDFSGSGDTTESFFSRVVNVATVDANTKNITSTVTWQENVQRAGSVVLNTYLTYWQRVVAGWSAPSIEATLDLAGNNDGFHVVASGDYAYLIRSAATSNLAIIDISDTNNPSLVTTLNLNGTPRDIAKSGNYVFITSSDNSSELQIVDVSTPSSPSLAATLNLNSGNQNADGRGVYIEGNYAYVTRASSNAPELYIVNISSPSSPSLNGTLELGADCFETKVLGSYAFIASGDNAQELKVVNVSNPAAPTQPANGFINLPGNTDATTIDGYGSLIMLGQGSTFYTVNVSTPATPVLSGSLAVTNTINDIKYFNDLQYAFLGKASGTQEFQVLDISAPASPASLSTLDLPNSANGVFYDSDKDRCYIANANNSGEFIIIEPQN